MTTTVNQEGARAAVARRETPTPLSTAKADIAKMKPQFELVLPDSIPADRLVRVLQTVITLNEDLAKPQFRQFLLGAAMTVAQLGLDPTPAIGHAWIVPFKGRPTFLLGYKGAVWLASDNGVHMKSHAIHEHDIYDVRLGTEAHIHHKLPAFNVDRGPAVAYYCVASFADGSPPIFDVMSVADVDRIRAASPGKDSPAWANHYDEMGKKTVLKRLSKSVPLGVKAAMAIAHDGVARANVKSEAIDATPAYEDADEGVVDAEIVPEGPCGCCGGVGDHDLDMHKELGVPVE